MFGGVLMHVNLTSLGFGSGDNVSCAAAAGAASCGLAGQAHAGEPKPGKG